MMHFLKALGEAYFEYLHFISLLEIALGALCVLVFVLCVVGLSHWFNS